MRGTEVTHNMCPFQDECEPLEDDTKWFRRKIGPKVPRDRTAVLHRKGKGPFIIVAPHGGKIEPRTEQIAGLLSEELGCACYCFCSGHLEKHRGGKGKKDRHHINSHHIEAPQLLVLLGERETAVSVHGLGWQRNDTIEVGGLHSCLRDRLKSALNKNRFTAMDPRHKRRAAECEMNVVNRCKGAEGI